MIKQQRSNPVRLTSAAVALGLVLAAATVAAAVETRRISVHSNGAQGNGPSYNPAVSGNGRYVAFMSVASNLVAGDAPAQGSSGNDVFVYDRKQRTTTRISETATGGSPNNFSDSAEISTNGRFVAFRSLATDILDGVGSGDTLVYVHDRKKRVTTLASVNSSGFAANGPCVGIAIAGRGRFVAFVSDATNLVPGANGPSDVYVHDRKKGITTRVSVDSSGVAANDICSSPAISANGRFVAFSSRATNLVPGVTNGDTQVYLHDRKKGRTTLVSADPTGAEGNNGSSSSVISANGRLIAFSSSASNLVPGDINGRTDVFVYDRKKGSIRRASVDSTGGEANGGSVVPAISANGRIVAFASSASNLVVSDSNGRSDTFVHDLRKRTTTRVSVTSLGAETNGNDGMFDSQALSANGRFVAFGSVSSNLVASDNNAAEDIFLHDRK